MTATLRTLALVALAALTAIAMPLSSHADGRSDWSDYAWQSYKFTDCVSTNDLHICPPYHQKWDWKRNQWVDIAITIDLERNQLLLSQTLTDSDAYDDDDVCVTALVLDADGENLIVHHQNWRMLHGQARSANYKYGSPNLARAKTIHIGSKQCRKGPNQDDAVYASVLAGIRR